MNQLNKSSKKKSPKRSNERDSRHERIGGRGASSSSASDLPVVLRHASQLQPLRPLQPLQPLQPQPHQAIISHFTSPPLGQSLYKNNTGHTSSCSSSTSSILRTFLPSPPIIQIAQHTSSTTNNDGQLELLVAMKESLTKNSSAKNTASFSLDRLRGCVETIVEGRDELLILATKADQSLSKKNQESFLNSRLRSLLPNKTAKKMGKKDSADLLVDFWFVYKEIVEETKVTRKLKKTLQDVEGMMPRIEDVSKNMLEEEQEKRKIMKSVPVDIAEKERKYLQGGGLRLPTKFPSCPKCSHCYVDQPPSNVQAEAENKANWKEYCETVTHIQQFNEGKRTDLPKNEKGKDIKKAPAPKTKHSRIRCHCLEFCASPHNGNCPIQCTDPELKCKYPRGKCPICNCSCTFTCTYGDYDAIKATIQLDKSNGRSTYRSNREEAVSFLTQSNQAGTLAANHASKFLANETTNGNIDCDKTQLQAFVNDQRSYAQASYIVHNAPNYGAIEFLQNQMKSVEHQDGPTSAEINGKSVDFRFYGTENAAKARQRNNRLQNADSLNSCPLQLEDSDDSSSSHDSSDIEIIEDSKPRATNLRRVSDVSDGSEEKVKRMKSRAQEKLYPKIPHNDLSAEQKEEKKQNLNAFKSYQRASKDGSCSDVIDIVGAEGEWKQGDSQEHNDDYVNIHAL